MTWYPRKKKPPVHVSVLGLTDQERMVEVSWTGKKWLDLHSAVFEIKVLYWRSLPRWEGKNSISKKQINLKSNTQIGGELRRLKRVIYDKETGKMRCI